MRIIERTDGVGTATYETVQNDPNVVQNGFIEIQNEVWI